MTLTNSQILATREHVDERIETHHQTGVLDARDLWPGTGGTVQLTRSGNLVELAVWGTPNNTAAVTQMTLPPGFRPPSTRLFNDAVYTEKQGSTRLNVYANGRVAVYGLTISEPVYFTLGWITEEPFPSLPLNNSPAAMGKGVLTTSD